MAITDRVYFNHLRGDILGGGTAAIVALALALAFGVALILDSSDVPPLAVTASPAIGNGMDKGLQVSIVGATGKIERRLEKLGILAEPREDHLLMERTEALQKAVTYVKGYGHNASSESFSDTEPLATPRN